MPPAADSGQAAKGEGEEVPEACSRRKRGKGAVEMGWPGPFILGQGRWPTTIILHPIVCVIVDGGRGRCSWGVPKRKWCGFGVVILAHLLLFLGVADEDNVVIVGRL
jgi:hypothetical protein